MSAVPAALALGLAARGQTADTVIRLPYDDALDLVGGSRDSAAALREGRIKIRGEVSTVTALLTWLQQAHPQRAS